MARNLTRFDPFAEIARFDPLHAMEDWLRDRSAAPSIRMDVEESDAAYLVKAEIPGVKKEDIQVEVEGNVVSISAELKREQEDKSGTVLRSERFYGAQRRSFTLARNIDAAKVEAKYADGVLSLVLPKLAGKTGRQVTVN